MGGDRLSYPVIYAETATDFFNLGLGTLPDATKVEVTEERNGEFTLSMTYLVDGLRANEIKKNRIIKVDAGHVLKDQRFVIKKINRQLVDKQLQLQVYAEHVSYITNDLQLKPNVTVNGSGDAAIKAWRSNIIDVNPLVVDSDIETNTSTTWTIDKVQSARQALGGVTGSLLDLWGGEYRFDNYHISLKKQRGTVANTLLSYGRNITDFDQEENITDTYTTVYPYATYTETTTTDDNASSESKLMTLPELTVDSEYVGNYPNRKILPVDLTSKFTDNEKPTIEKLREYAKAYVKSNSIGIPTVSIKLSYVDLSQSSNYEALKLLEVLDLCDTVPVRFSKLGVDTKTKVSRVVWDVLAEHYTSMELGDTRYTIGDMINNALNTANEANQNSQEAQNSANHAVVSADGHTMIFYGPNTPIAKNIGDLWYEPDGEYETMYRWDGTVWAFVMSTRDTADAKDAADKAQKEAEEAQKTANESVATANDAVAKAGFANDTATQAKSDAATAGQQANKAVDGANDAAAKAGFATDTATQAKSDAATAGQQAKDALTNAGTALDNAKTALDNVTTLDQTVKTEVSNINGELKQKVDQTVFDKLNGTVTTQATQISQNKKDIELKADLSVVDTIKQTVTSNTAAIGVNADTIKLKANQSDVNSLTGRVTTAEGKLTVQAGQIAQTVSKTELSSTLNGYATQTWTQGQIKATADQIKLGVTQVQNNLNNMQIGGRNYVLNSAKIKVPPTTDQVMYLSTKLSEFSKKIVAVSCRVDYDNHVSGNRNRYGIELHGTDVAGKDFYVGVWKNAIAGESFHGTITAIVQVPEIGDSNDQHEIWAYNQGVTNGGSVTKPKLEIGTKASDWTEAPEDYVTAVKFATLELTVNGIQGTVASKADQSQVTQLAGQIAQTVSKTELSSTLNGYATQTWTQGQIKTTADQIKLSVSQVQSNLDNLNIEDRNLYLGTKTMKGWQKRGNATLITLDGEYVTDVGGDWAALWNPVHLEKGKKYKWSIDYKGIVNTGIQLNLYVSPINGDPVIGKIIARDLQTVWNRAYGEFVSPFTGDAMVRSEVANGDWETLKHVYTRHIKLSQSDKDTGWSEAPEDSITDVQFSQLQVTVNGIQGTVQNKADQSQVTQLAGQITSVVGDVSANSSQITQMKADINLRVKAGDVINQINISPEGILIDGKKAHITGQTTIDNAVIKDAMIANVTADKITAGTLNAANVNVINLNANNITTGTIKGANLSLNLNTGEVVFQHGRIHSASDNVDVNIDQGYLSTASSDTRVMLKEGQLQLVQPTIFDNSKDPYLQISNSIGGASFNGANIIARDYLVLANRANSDAFFDAPLDGPETFAGLAVGKTSADRWKPTRIGGAERGIIMRGGTAYKIDSSFMYRKSPEILVGTDAAGLKPSDRIYINGSFVHIPSAYWRTASGSANLMVAQDGALVRSTSASKYKTDIVRTNIPDYGEKLLNLPTATWTDIAETKRFRDDPVNQPEPTRNFGMIAEDLADAGLEMLVVRGLDGELEGINYDRIGPALIPVIAKLKNKIEKLEQKLEEPA